jgi:hypothetical protein
MRKPPRITVLPLPEVNRLLPGDHAKPILGPQLSVGEGIKGNVVTLSGSEGSHSGELPLSFFTVFW